MDKVQITYISGHPVYLTKIETTHILVICTANSVRKVIIIKLS